MAKTHLKILGVDCRKLGQTEYEYDHQSACGYVRTSVSTDIEKVDCFYCSRSKEAKQLADKGE